MFEYVWGKGYVKMGGGWCLSGRVSLREKAWVWNELKYYALVNMRQYAFLWAGFKWGI